MGRIIPFITRIGASGDWSAEERARLGELGERLIAAGLKVEVIYGATEEGDPWCVVKDESEEVLIHVARIGGAFVIHYSLDDSLRQGDDLPAILSERLAWEESHDGVTPFSRQAQGLLVLIVATAFFYESARHEEGSPSATSMHLDPAGENAGHAAVGVGADAHHLDDAFAASRALHAEAMAQATAPATLPGEPASPRAEWRSLALQDDDIGRADHGGGELALARHAPAGFATVSNLDVASPVAGPSVIVAFDSRFAADRAPPPSAPSLLTTSATTSAPHTPFVASNFRSGDPGHPAPTPPQTAEHPVAVASHWIDVDLDGDGRPDVRLQVPDDPKALAKEPEAPPVHAADHEAIMAVGQGFPHAEIA